MMLLDAQQIFEITMPIGENYCTKILWLNHVDKLNIAFNIEHFFRVNVLSHFPSLGWRQFLNIFLFSYPMNSTKLEMTKLYILVEMENADQMPFFFSSAPLAFWRKCWSLFLFFFPFYIFFLLFLQTNIFF